MDIINRTFMGGFGGGKTSMEEFAAQLKTELDLEDFFEQVEKSLRVELTPATYLMLLVPLVEVNRRAQLDTNEWRYFGKRPPGLVIDRTGVHETLLKLLVEIAQSPAAGDITLKRKEADLPLRLDPFEEDLPVRSSLSAIKAYWKRFCDIPPFCGETKKE